MIFMGNPSPNGPVVPGPDYPQTLRLAQASLQLRLLDQPLILMGQQVPVNLRHGIHRRRHHDEQRGAAQQDDAGALEAAQRQLEEIVQVIDLTPDEVAALNAVST